MTSDETVASINVLLDDVEVFDWNGRLDSLSDRAPHRLSKRTLGFYGYNVDASYHQAKLKLLRGGADLTVDPRMQFIDVDQEVDVLPHVIAELDVTSGDWSHDEAGLVSDNRMRNVLQAPIDVRGSYEFIVDFTPLETRESFGFVLPIADSVVCADLNAHEQNIAGLSNIDGNAAFNNTTTSKLDPFEVGTTYRYMVQVRELGEGQVDIVATLNEQQLFHWTGNQQQLTSNVEIADPNRPSITSYMNRYRVSSMKFRLIDGTARLRTLESKR